MKQKQIIELSIIIPVYNSEHTIKQVVEKLKKEFYGKVSFEIILVNDGSKDSSYDKCKDLADSNDFIKFIKY